MKLNTNKLSREMEGSGFSKTEIASRCGIDRKTIENVLAGRDPKLSTVISLASFLDLKISYLFDEEITEVREAGLDFPEKGKAKHSGIEYNDRGFGLDTVVSYANQIRIMSGKELFYSDNEANYQRTWNVDFDFSGTSIYFDMPISGFDDADYLDDMEL